MSGAPESGVAADCAGRSDVGRVRSLNEDRYLLRPEVGLWAVADGMGGHDAGDFASETVMAELGGLAAHAALPGMLEAFDERVSEANRRLLEAARRAGPSVIGCTLAALLVAGGQFACIWAGDSRVYRIRGGRIEQISHDHTEVQELIDQGVLAAEDALRHPRRNVITRAIGIFDVPELDLVEGPVESGDVFLICSDGLTEHVANDEILAAAENATAAGFCDDLIALALERGGSDNVTVVAVRFG